MKLLIIKTSAIGDVLRTTSILQGLKEKYKNLFITWLIEKKAYGIIRTNPFIQRILILEYTKRIDDKFDLIINLEESKQICELISQVDKRKIFGAYLQDNGILYSDDSRRWLDLSLISRFGKEKANELKKINSESYQKIISDALGISASKPILNLTEKEKVFSEQFKREKSIIGRQMVIGINTSAGNKWKHKSLSIKKTIELINEIKKEFDARILIFGENREMERNRIIIENTGIINTGNNNSLMKFASLVNLCDIMITSDSLALHVATALDKKVIVFLGPTSSAEIELYEDSIKIIPNMDCLCCYKNDCDFNPSCMDTIETTDFIKAIKSLQVEEHVFSEK